MTNITKYIILIFLLVLGSKLMPATAASVQAVLDEIEKTSKEPNEIITLSMLALQNCQHAADKNCEGILLKYIGSAYQKISKYDSALYYYSRSKEIAEETNDRQLIAALLYNTSTIYSNRGEYQQALSTSLEALAIDKESGDIENVIESLNGVATIYENLNLFDKALTYQLEAVELCEVNRKVKALAVAHFNLANIYVKNGKPDKAMLYYNFANNSYDELLIKDTTEFTLFLGKSEVEYAIGSLHLQKEEFETAFIYFEKSLRIKKTISDRAGISKCLMQLANIQFQKGTYEEALQLNFESLQEKLLINDKQGQALLYSNIGKIKLRQGKFDEAVLFIKRSIGIATEVSAFTILKENYQMLSQLYTTMQQYKDALLYKTLFTQMLDTLHMIQGQRAVQEMSIKYETQKTEQANELLQKDNDLKELTIKKQKLMTFMFLGIAILVLVIVVIIYILYRAKKKAHVLVQGKNLQLNKQKDQIEKQKKVIEIKNRDLTDSILYAKRIQESMLVHPEEILQNIKDYFILFKPKDIVSGDFYWLGEKDGKIIFSAIDCTGHGVPGAFMSMLGDSYLNQIVHNFDITEPDEILNELNKHIREALNQEETQNQDGMDMVLSTIDLERKTVDFACAKNPMVYIQNGALTKIKGENQPIGGGGYEHVPFTKHRISIESPTTFYMFSDGFQDQFGGPKNKKFMVKKMQQMMLEIHEKPMTEQKQIFEQALMEWMGTNEQVDDVVLIGFKV